MNADERLALAKVMDLLRSPADKRYSDFLDPVKAAGLYKTVSGERGVNAYLFGGFDASERKMLGICPDYMEISDSEFPIDVLNISYNTRFSRELSHRDFLGSILGLGIDRSRVGDIVIKDAVAHAFVCREIAGYILGNLERVGAVKVKVTPGSAAEAPEPAGRELRLTVASPRLDAVIGAVFKLSRAEARACIEGERVFVNWATVISAAKQVTQDDVITLRGAGRVKVLELSAHTRKNRLVLRVLKY